jgi:predicted TIM-barrel fold metal-dependent hydrolase
VFKGSGGGALSRKSTFQIGEVAVTENNKTYSKSSDIGELRIYENSNLEMHNIMIVMPMDMEYALIAGYQGQTIYHDDEDPWYYYERRYGWEEEHKGTKISMHPQEGKFFSKLNKQLKETNLICCKNPLKLIPMFHYDPRRFGNDPSGQDSRPASNYTKTCWDSPFNVIAGPIKDNSGLYIGFKMYTPHGYRPLDPECKHLDKFYAKCAAEEIPVLAHCTKGGNVTHEMPFYWEHINCDSREKPSAEEKEEYFWNEFVHPAAWEKVLKKHPSLKLCLAHLGGDELAKEVDNPSSNQVPANEWVKKMFDMMTMKNGSDYAYPNFYSDISCFDTPVFEPFTKMMLYYKKNDNEAYQRIKQRLLFGSDWYMTTLVNGESQTPVPGLNEIKSGVKYEDYCTMLKKMLDQISKSLWVRFTLINPFCFYGLGNAKVIENMDSFFKKQLPGMKVNLKNLEIRKKTLLELGGKMKDVEEYVRKLDCLYE